MTLDVAIQHRFATFTLDVAFTAPAGITALFGRSGAGKTTVVNVVAGLIRPDQGRISVNSHRLLDTQAGFELPTHRRKLGYVFQDARLFPHLSVRHNLLFGRWFSGTARSEDELGHVVDLLGIAGLMSRRPGTLSGGERQRVAIGRALLSQPRMLLMDEPLAALDEARKAEILPYVERLRDELEIPILYVSHAVPEVARLATTIVALSDGRVVRQGAAADILADPTLFPLMGRREAGSILNAKVVSHDTRYELTILEISGGRLISPRIMAEPGTRLRVRVRARDIILALKPPEDTSALNILPVIVEQIGNQDGPIVDVAVRCGEEDLLVRITRRSLDNLALEPGKPCFAMLKSIALARRDIGIVDPRRD
jgi:molybdate transport system ATP-binding protein